MNDASAFAERLAAFVQRSGMTQQTLAERVPLNASYLNKILRGKRKPPTRAKVLAMGQVLRLSLDEINELLALGPYTPVRPAEWHEVAAWRGSVAAAPLSSPTVFDSVETLHYPEPEVIPKRPEDETLTAELHRLLAAGDITGRRPELLDLLHSYFSWLKYRLEVGR